MKNSRYIVWTISAVVIAGLALKGVAVASGKATELALSKKIAKTLEKAGLEHSKIDAILEQARTHAPELKEMWQTHTADIKELSRLSPENEAEVRQKVTSMVDRFEQSRTKLRSMVEELGNNLSAKEKGQLVLHISSRLEQWQGQRTCGSRADLVLEKIQDSELFSAADKALIESKVESVLPTLCNQRDAMKASLASLKSAMEGGSEAAIESSVKNLKASHEEAVKLRSEAVTETLTQLSPSAQIAVAKKVVKLQSALQILFGA